MRNKSILKAGLAAIALMVMAPAANAADDGVNVGTLRCHVEGGWGHVVASNRDMSCVFNPVDGRDERYTGELSRYGIDLGYTNDATLVWAVFAPTSDMRSGGLEGDWTEGCIAMKNEDIRELFDAVNVAAPAVILP